MPECRCRLFASLRFPFNHGEEEASHPDEEHIDHECGNDCLPTEPLERFHSIPVDARNGVRLRPKVICKKPIPSPLGKHG